MRDFRQTIADLLATLPSLSNAGLAGAEISEILEVPSDETLGDFAFPCFRLAKALKKAPNEIAADVVREFAEVSKQNGGELFAESVGSYVNFRLDAGVLAKETLGAILLEGENYGRSELGNGKRVIVEYSSPNIAKPFHIGHIRSTVIGSALANILSALGYDVVRVNHLGDYGTQFGKLIVAYRKFGSREEVESAPIASLQKYYVRFHGEAEKDPALDDEARAAFAALERGEKEEVSLWEWFREESLKEFERVYKKLGVEFDSYAGESFYSDKMGRVVDVLKEKGLLKESEGAQIVDLDVFALGKALIMKNDGSTLYITRDIAAAIYRKQNYDFHKNIYVVANQQELHFKQLFKIIELLGYDWAKDCVHAPFGLVRLQDGAMSTRTGNVVLLEDLLSTATEKAKALMDEKGKSEPGTDADGELTRGAATPEQIGIGAVIFQELHNSRIKDYVFDWERALNFDGETGPYVQYMHARCASVLRKAEAEQGVGAADFANINIDLQGSIAALASVSAAALIKKLYEFPAAIVEAGEKLEPSVLTRHIADIAQAFSVFYHEERILGEEEGAQSVKLALTFATKQVLANGLKLIGLAAPERM